MAKKVEKFFQNLRKLTDKFSAYDSAWTNGNASVGVVVAGKLGHRVSITAGNRSTNANSPDILALAEYIVSKEGRAMLEAVSAKQNS